MTIQSLNGPVTQTEISSFESFMAGQSPPTANTYDNTIADGTAGMECEALGLMYEITNDPVLLNQMIAFSDQFLALRNDLETAAQGGQRVMWDGNIDPVWLTKPAGSQGGYAGCENNDIVGHIAFCARLIFQTPSLWNVTVPDGDPFGTGTTYYERAQTFLTQMEYVQINYMLKYFINPANSQIIAPTSSAWTSLNENVNAWNRQMMFMNGFQRLSECHQLLQDNPAKVAQYDAIVQACMNWFISGLSPYTANGQPVYNWTYQPGGSGSEDNTLHSTYDIWGITRAWESGRYGLSNATMVPFANTLQYVMNVSTNHISYYVNGTEGSNSPRSFIYPGWMPIANFGPTTYAIMANMNIAQGSQASTAIFDAFILWDKNKRYLGIYPTNNNTADYTVSTPWIENVAAGGNVTCQVTVNPLNGFNGSVTLGASGLPTGVTASYNPSSITGSGTSTLTLTASSSTAPGIYSFGSLAVTGSSSSLARTAPLTLNVRSEPNFTISASPSSQNITIGGNTSYSVTIAPVSGFNGNVALSVNGLPANASGSFSPSSITGGSGSSTLNVSTATNTANGNYTLTITGISGTLTNTTTVTLLLNDFIMSVSPSSQAVIVGGSTNYTVTVGNVNGFDGTVNFSASGLPGGAAASFNPASITAIGSSTMTVTTTNTTPVSTNTLTITGTSGNLVHSTTATFAVTNNVVTGNFTLSATPTSQAVVEGNGTNYTITVTPSGGFNGSVNLSISGLGVDETANFSPSSITGGSGSSTLTVNTTTGTPGANGYTLTVTGVSGSLTNTVVLNLTVNPLSPGGPLPAGWTDADIGGPLYLPGSAGYTSGLFTLNGSGTDIWGTNDQFNFAYEPVTNSSQTIIAEVTSQQDSDPWAKAGVMFRETTASNATDVGIYITPGNGVSMQYRNGTGAGAIQTTNVTGPVAPYWVALVRNGNTFTGYSAPDGSTWTQIGSATVTMLSNAAAGLAVCSHNYYQLNTSMFTNVSIVVPNFSISASPSSQTVTAGGNTTYTATVTALNWFSGNVALTASGLPAGATASFNPATISGSGSSTLTITTTNTMASSTNTVTITGTSGSLTQNTTVTLVLNGQTGGGSLPAGWTDSDIGAVGIAGSAGYTNGVFTIQGSGADIYGTNDEFNFCRETATNNFTITAKVASQNSANSWSKSGVMIRGTASANSAYIGVYITPANGVDMQCRTVNGASAVDMARVSGVTAPYWVRLVRSGNTFTGYSSPDGVSWTQVSSTNISMSGSVRAGLAVCSHNNGALNTSTFANVSISISNTTSVSLSSAFNREGIVTDGTTFSSSGGLDAHGYAYSSNLLGTTSNVNGVPFTLGAANASNAVSASGNSITLPSGNFSSLQMLATAVNGNQASQTFTVYYTDGSNSTFTQSVSDWGSSQGYAGETLAAQMSYRDKYNGSTSSGTFTLYGYSFSLNSGKTVSSVTLPNNANIEVLSLTLVQ